MYEYDGINMIDQFTDEAFWDRLTSVQPFANDTLKAFNECYGKAGEVIISIKLNCSQFQKFS